jgi:RNA polymerase sigma-54 factor
MKPGLQVRLSQQLALTPQLQQSIRLLQLSTLELQQEVEQMLAANPFLDAEEAQPSDAEIDRADWQATATADARGAEDDTDSRREAGPSGALEPSSDAAEAPADATSDAWDAAGEREDWANGTEDDDFDGIRETNEPSLGQTSNSQAQGDGDGEGQAQDRSQGTISLVEHLREQKLGLRLDVQDSMALDALIDSLNDDGYLEDPLAAIAERLALEALSKAAQPADAGANFDGLLEAWQDRLRCARGWLQSMDPCGVGAADLAECLTLQLRAMPRSEAQVVAILVAKQHLPALAKRDFKRLMAVTGAEEPLLRQAQALIVSCEPKPARAFSRTEHHALVPDVIVRKAGRGLKVTLNAEVMPKLRINEVYAQALRGQRDAAAAQARLQEARWFLKNIKQRFDTILRVSTAIVERQRGFFTHGEIAMRPLVLREIADELGLHESTISRVTTAKYMATPQGTFELKYFFGSSLATQAGGNASSTAVRALIKQLVSAEHGDDPLSDNQLASLLAAQGITVARRTVAKYREALRIAPAHVRRVSSVA